MAERKTIRVYGCGGTGYNVVSKLTDGFCPFIPNDSESYHFVISNEGINEAFDDVSAIREGMNEQRSKGTVRQRQDLGKISGINVDDETGLVF